MSKNFYKTEEAPANNSGTYTRPDDDGSSSGGVARGGKKKKKKKNPWDKYSPDAILGKYFSFCSSFSFIVNT